MGQDILQTQFAKEDYVHFRESLNENLKTFRRLLDQPGFGEGKPSYGSELELYLIGDQAQTRPINQRILQSAQDDQLTLELNQFNLEYNFAPLIDESSPFSRMKSQMDKALGFLDGLCAQHESRILPIGILPTLKADNMGLNAITDVPRYHVLAKALRDKRGEDFKIHIGGQEPLDLTWSDVSLEGANTSFQFHYRVSPNEFAKSYNAAQLTAPLSLALAANSPVFLGQRLWQETRIALFKQSIDYRLEDALSKHLPARVLFGLGWVREGIYELFAEGVYLFDSLMPILSGIDSNAQLNQGLAPELGELRLHQGSIWTWNRPIYDPADDGHLRIEIRTLPAGPTPANMCANAALLSGWMKGLVPYIDDILPGIPFRYAEQNFYRAAKFGLDAKLFWPNLRSGILEEREISGIIEELMPTAVNGLQALGITDGEIERQMAVIKGGLETRTNGSQWQLSVFEKLLQQTDRETALRELVERYYTHYQQGQPVHEWSQSI